MAAKRNKGKKGKAKKPLKQSHPPDRSIERISHLKRTIQHPSKVSTISSALASVTTARATDSLPERRVFSIEIRSIDGETTIGDLIVAFPRTRDVLMKHGLRFDVEEAGYLYMTLNVFSAIHGLATNSLVQELNTASKEPLLQSNPQQVRPIITAPTT